MTRKPRTAPTPGAFFQARYPFVRDSYTAYDGETQFEMASWKPGTRGEAVYPDDSIMVCDALGEIHLTVISVHKPGRYPTRVFFTRQWQDPDGKTFGKAKLRCATVSQFFALSNGYRHEYEMASEPLPAQPCCSEVAL